MKKKQKKQKRNIGKKFDNGKDRWDLLPISEVRDVVRVLTYGAVKYDDDNWKIVDKKKDRYYSAALRHITAWKDGNLLDEETDLPHLAHAICCLLFLMWGDKQ